MPGSKVRAVIIPSRKMWDEICDSSEILYAADYKDRGFSRYGKWPSKTLVYHPPRSSPMRLSNAFGPPPANIMPAYEILIDLDDTKSLIRIFKIDWSTIPTRKHLVFQQLFYELPMLDSTITEADQLPGLVKAIAIANDWY